MPSRLLCAVLALSTLAAVTNLQAAEYQPADPPLVTRWTKEVSPENALPEYPRPQMVREQWQNLNGLWKYAITDREAPQPAELEGEILVPYPIESALSGVKRRLGYTERLWYHRTFRVPGEWRGQRLLLHFGAVDWEAVVLLNGRLLTTHRGGYDGFSVDVTDHLREGDVDQELVVAVWDPSTQGNQPRGKQSLTPEGVWYTCSSGIWQTVWIEPVPEAHIEQISVVPDVDESMITVKVTAAGTDEKHRVLIVASDGNRLSNAKLGKPGEAIEVKIPHPKLWSPDSPHLYDLKVSLLREGKYLDRIESYFGMRKVSLGPDEHGVTRILLNDEPLFQYGLLDQGFWPDGLYTAPTDAALKYDIEMTQKLGFNLIRKHVKVEPARWYAWCDRMGMLVWQDMPNGDRFLNVFKEVPDPDLKRSPESAKQFEIELREMITELGNHPSILMWIPFNEGWGQYDTARITEMTKKLDPSRLVNSASGLVDRGTGEVNDIHNYLGERVPESTSERAVVLGEFGGLGMVVSDHIWTAKNTWDYKSFDSRKSLTDAYLQKLENVRLLKARGMSAAVYTQTTDVELEVNGQVTYDRELLKLDTDRIVAAHKSLFEPSPRITPLIETAERDGKSWRYSITAPSSEWMQPEYDDGAWQEAPGVFGKQQLFKEWVRTDWKRVAIWLRRRVELPAEYEGELNLMVHHAGAIDVYLNGKLVLSRDKGTAGYRFFPLDAEAVAALKLGEENVIAIHSRADDEQYVDVGLMAIER